MMGGAEAAVYIAAIICGSITTIILVAVTIYGGKKKKD